MSETKGKGLDSSPRRAGAQNDKERRAYNDREWRMQNDNKEENGFCILICNFDFLCLLFDVC
jgi:hypothetical protein